MLVRLLDIRQEIILFPTAKQVQSASRVFSVAKRSKTRRSQRSEKRIYSDNEANTHDDGDEIFAWYNESFIFITKHSECFRDLINILSNDAVDCSQCGYSFDSFPTLRMFQDHLAIHRNVFFADGDETIANMANHYFFARKTIIIVSTNNTTIFT